MEAEGDGQEAKVSSACSARLRACVRASDSSRVHIWCSLAHVLLQEGTGGDAELDLVPQKVSSRFMLVYDAQSVVLCSRSAQS